MQIKALRGNNTRCHRSCSYNIFEVYRLLGSAIPM